MHQFVYYFALVNHITSFIINLLNYLKQSSSISQETFLGNNLIYGKKPDENSRVVFKNVENSRTWLVRRRISNSAPEVNHSILCPSTDLQLLIIVYELWHLWCCFVVSYFFPLLVNWVDRELYFYVVYIIYSSFYKYANLSLLIIV